MKEDFSRIRDYWGDGLHRLPEEHIKRLGLDSWTNNFLIDVGLPAKIDLRHALEIKFYLDKEKIIKQVFGGCEYVILGDDSGTKLGISLTDYHLYSLDFDFNTDAESVCFVNSSIDKFVETIQIFMEYQNISENHSIGERDLIKSMREKIVDIDEKSLENETTWWGQVINDPI